MHSEEYLDDLRQSRVLDPSNVAVIRGFIAAFEACETVAETRAFVQELRSIVGSQFLSQMSVHVRKDPTMLHRYLNVINGTLEKWERDNGTR